MIVDRDEFAYAARYCEENIWQLVQSSKLANLELDVVFISNGGRTCALWNQRASAGPSEPVIWDYHVIAISFPANLAFDLDSRCSFPHVAVDYLQETFPLAGQVPEAFAPRFRVIAAKAFVAKFASDRSHMREGERYLAPPPDWPPPTTSSSSMNLMEFVQMARPFVGEVMDLSGMIQRLAGAQTSGQAS